MSREILSPFWGYPKFPLHFGCKGTYGMLQVI